MCPRWHRSVALHLKAPGWLDDNAAVARRVVRPTGVRLRKITNTVLAGLLCACGEPPPPPPVVTLESVARDDSVDSWVAGYDVDPSVLGAAPPGAARPRSREPLVVRVSPLARELVASHLELPFEERHPGIDLQLFESSERGGSEELILRRADAALVMVAPSPQDRGHGLSSRLLGHHIVVVVVPMGSPARSVTDTQLRGLLNGSIEQWNTVAYLQGKVEIVLGPRGHRHAQARQLLLAGDRFARRAAKAPSMSAVAGQVAARPRAVGVMDLRSLESHTGVRPLAVDGVVPSVKNFENGRYPFGLRLSLVHRQTPAPHVATLLEWLAGPEGRQALGHGLSQR